jgi:hypothetical protein
MKTSPPLCLLVALIATQMCLLRAAADDAPIDIGQRRELFVDEFLLARRNGVELKLHAPTLREVVLVHDQPWEGTGCGYHRIFRDGDRWRMYYVGSDLTNEDATKFVSHPIVACYAESTDGLQWHRPNLGLIEFKGSKDNNIIWNSPGLDNFTPFKDANPDCRSEERYKSVYNMQGGLGALKSADGIHWSPLTDGPIITQGRFDSQNNAFWDPARKHYWCYLRDFHNGIRDIRVATSTDFRTWSAPQLLKFVDSPDEQLYTNQVELYERAPHIFIGFPTRYLERAWSPSFDALPDREHRQRRAKISLRYGTAVTDGLFMTSRDGRTFHRWGEAFLRPGPERKHNWTYGDGYQHLGLIKTASADPDAPPELSLYVIEDNWKRATRLRRYTLRIDGFVSLHARQKPGEVTTRPIVFQGKRLTLNFATSAAGSVRAELQDASGAALPGFALADCDEIFGDTLERTVSWKGQSDVSSLAGKPVSLRLVLSDADVYSLKFEE